MFHTPEKVSLTFDPRTGGDDAKCVCDGVEQVGVVRKTMIRNPE